jgi:hyperosmotically inducible periplasmic protein
MMNSQSTSKIVVGVGLAAVFGIGVSVFAMRAKQVSQAAQHVPAPAATAAPLDPTATDPSLAAQSAAGQTPASQTPASQTPSNQTATAMNTPPVMAPAADPMPSNFAKSDATSPPSDESKPAKPKASNDRHVAKTRSNSDDTSNVRVASAASPKNSDSMKSSSEPAPVSSSALSSSNDTTSPATVGAASDTQPATSQTAQETAPSANPAATSNESAASDSQITTDVKSQIATAAPNSSVDVTTTNGVVALAGSVANSDAIDQAKQAAQRVAGVKQVDASALMVSNR